MRGIPIIAIVMFYSQLGATAASAEEADNALIVESGAPLREGVAMAVSDELISLDFQVLMSEVRFVGGVGLYLEVARENGAGFLVRLHGLGDGGVIADVARVRGDSISVSQLRFLSSSDTATIALRVAEAVRAKGLEIPEASSEKTARPEPKPAEPKDDEAEHWFSLGVGPALNLSPGGVGPVMALGLSVGLKPLKAALFELDGGATVLSSDIAGGGSKASFNAAFFRFTAYLDPVSEGVVYWAIGLSAGTVVAWTKGLDRDPSLNFRDKETLAYLGGAFRTRFRVSEPFSIVFGVRIGVLAPRVEIRFDDALEATFGRPLLDAYLNAEFHF